MVVDGVLAEGREILPIEGEGRDPGYRHARALEELHGDRAGDGLVRGVDEGVERFPKRGEPVALVDQLPVPGREPFLVRGGRVIQRQRLQVPQGGVQDGGGGRLVHPPALHPDQAVLHQIAAADAM